MVLPELIIKAHAHSHAAELAVQAKSPNSAYDEMMKLWTLLGDWLPGMEPLQDEPSDDDKT